MPHVTNQLIAPVRLRLMLGDAINRSEDKKQHGKEIETDRS